MESLLDAVTLTLYVKEYLVEWATQPLSFGLFLGAVLEILGYGIFKALSLINIK